MKSFAADLHIHTALSPCAADEMTPPAIVRAALETGLQMIAICDHNTAGNTAACQAAAARCAADTGAALAVLAGMEVTTAEEVHVVSIFPDPPAAEAAAAEVRATLPDADPAYYARFGGQHLLDADGEVIGTEPKMLATATTLDLAATVALIHRHRGVALAAHVNRPSFSVLSQLGLFPPDAGFDAIEVFTPAGAPPGGFSAPTGGLSAPAGGLSAPAGGLSTPLGAAFGAASVKQNTARTRNLATASRPDSRTDRAVKSDTVPDHVPAAECDRAASAVPVQDGGPSASSAPLQKCGTAESAVQPAGLAVVASSDAHYPTDIGTVRCELTLEAPTFAEFVLALRGTGGRGVRCA
jgi:3',5'-nucleoside bisphosphate phosphatase